MGCMCMGFQMGRVSIFSSASTSITRSGVTPQAGSMVMQESQLFASPSGFSGFMVIAGISAKASLYCL